MPRKPAILLSALLLLLSIGGAVFYQKLRQHAPPDFAEIDTYFRTTDFAGWRLKERADMKPATYRIHGWWDKLGIQRREVSKQDSYTLMHDGKPEKIVVSVFRSDGKVADLTFGGVMEIDPADIETIRKIIIGKFPQLRRSEQ